MEEEKGERIFMRVEEGYNWVSEVTNVSSRKDRVRWQSKQSNGVENVDSRVEITEERYLQ